MTTEYNSKKLYNEKTWPLRLDIATKDKLMAIKSNRRESFTQTVERMFKELKAKGHNVNTMRKMQTTGDITTTTTIKAKTHSQDRDTAKPMVPVTKRRITKFV